MLRPGIAGAPVRWDAPKFLRHLACARNPASIDQKQPLLLLRSCLVHAILLRRDGIRFIAFRTRTPRSTTGGTRTIGLDKDDFGSRIRCRGQPAYWRAHWQHFLAIRSASRWLWHDALGGIGFPVISRRVSGHWLVRVRGLTTISRSAGMVSARSQSKNARKIYGNGAGAATETGAGAAGGGANR